MVRTLVSALFCLTLLAGCGGTTPPAPANECAPPAGIELTDIERVTDWINAMPKPLELPCFLASLPRPLALNATVSTFSAQPANGRRNPRVFIFLGDLTLSVVPQEAAKPEGPRVPENLLEMSLRTDGIHSIKAELAFPIQQPITYSAAYTRLRRSDDSSQCGVCHAGEVRVGEFGGVPVYQSAMLAPYDDAVVSLGFLLNEAKFCNPDAEPHRCAMLAALVGDGDIFWLEFPPEVPVL